MEVGWRSVRFNRPSAIIISSSEDTFVAAAVKKMI